VFSAVALCVAGLIPVAGATGGIRCGSRITKSVELDHDVGGCAGNGLVVAADDIEIDLNGYALTGRGGAGSGVYNDGHDGVVVREGMISGFREGVLVKGAASNQVEGIAFRHDRSAVVFSRATKSVVEESDLEGNGAGILVKGRRNAVVRNDISGGRPGIALIGDRNRAERNDISYPSAGRSGPAIVFEGDGNAVVRNDVSLGETGVDGIGNNNSVTRNDLESGAGNGIVVEGSRNDLESNDVADYRGHGIWLSGDETQKRNRLVHNLATGNGKSGGLVESQATVVLDNDFGHNGADGLAVSGKQARIDHNDASRNARYGIFVSGSQVEGKGNSADDNAGPAQCKPAGLCD
jgi:hypothetical protein